MSCRKDGGVHTHTGWMVCTHGAQKEGVLTLKNNEPCSAIFFIGVYSFSKCWWPRSKVLLVPICPLCLGEGEIPSFLLVYVRKNLSCLSWSSGPPEVPCSWAAIVVSLVYVTPSWMNGRRQNIVPGCRSFTLWRCPLGAVYWLSATPRTVACLPPPSMGFSRQEYWSGLPSLPLTREKLFGLPGPQCSSPKWKTQEVLEKRKDKWEEVLA